MHELHNHGNGSPAVSRAEINARLLGRVRAIGERLGAAVDRLRAGVAPSPSRSLLLEQLRETLAGLPPDLPAAAPIFRGPKYPLDRLTAELSLSPFELDLLILAGL